MSDPIASHRAAQFITDRLDREAGYNQPERARQLGTLVADEFAVTFERRVNEAGVPVRRLILTGPDEVDGAQVAGHARGAA
jgi:hypothetical protein